jgi:hypothetical protein
VFNAFGGDYDIESVIAKRQLRYVTSNWLGYTFLACFYQQLRSDVDTDHIRPGGQRPAAEKTRAAPCVQKFRSL